MITLIRKGDWQVRLYLLVSVLVALAGVYYIFKATSDWTYGIWPPFYFAIAATWVVLAFKVYDLKLDMKALHDYSEPIADDGGKAAGETLFSGDAEKLSVVYRRMEGFE